MRMLFCALLLAVAAAALPEEREIAAAKEKIQKLLDEAARLDESGRREEAARVRADAESLRKRLEAERGPREGDDPRMQALHCMEKAIAALDKAGYEGMAGEMRGMADRLRAEVKGARGQGNPDADFWRRNLDTLRIARKGLEEAGRGDGAELLGRAIHAREFLVEGKPDRAEQAMREGPDDGQLAELLLVAAKCWHKFEQPDKAARCEELGRFFQHRLEKRPIEKEREPARGERREGPGPDDRMAQLEERVQRMERMLRETLERLEAREREREGGK